MTAILRTLRRSAVALVPLLAACTPEGPQSLLAPDHLQRTIIPGPGTVTLTLCKVGGDAETVGDLFNFTITASNPNGDVGNVVSQVQLEAIPVPTFDADDNIFYEADKCAVVWSRANTIYDGETTITITEDVPDGYKLDRVVVNMVNVNDPGGEFENPGSSFSLQAHHGAVVFFKNLTTETPPPPPPPPPSGGEGCTPGYWKQSQHFDSWTAPYTPSTLFNSVFGTGFAGKTLLDVVSQGGGHEKALGRHAVAALLNAASSDVDYGMTVSEVIDAFNAAFTSGDYETTKNMFEALNEKGCPLN